MPRNRLFKLVFLSLASSLLACAPTLDVYTRASPSASFSRYRTFALGSAEQAPLGYRRAPLTPEVLGIVDSAAKEWFAARGYHAAPLESSDLILRVGVGTRPAPSSPSINQDAVGNPVDAPADINEGPFHYTEQTLVIDAFDAKSGQRVWHGSAREIIDPHHIDDSLIRRAVRGMLIRFPAIT